MGASFVTWDRGVWPSCWREAHDRSLYLVDAQQMLIPVSLRRAKENVAPAFQFQGFDLAAMELPVTSDSLPVRILRQDQWRNGTVPLQAADLGASFANSRCLW